ncbi:MAG: hypothetical protein SGPRY_000399 [Prymnesium sp.]
MDGPPLAPPSEPREPSPPEDPSPIEGNSVSRTHRIFDSLYHLLQSLRQGSPSDDVYQDVFIPTSLGFTQAMQAQMFVGPRRPHSSSDLVSESADPREEDCAVCLAPMTERCVRTPCGHYFHKDCLEQYSLVAREPGRRTRCPLCRSSLQAVLPVEASASSGRAIEVVNVPKPGEPCHIDRPYAFRSLGGFASKPRMLYVFTSNDDRKTPHSEVMWTIRCSMPVTIHLNFRSDRHADAVRHCANSYRCATSGCHGPVYSRSFPAGVIPLYGSNTWEGTYFVFVEMEKEPTSSRDSGAETSARDEQIPASSDLASASQPTDPEGL